MSQLRIGCSGWVYKDWKGPFYPPGVKDRERLEYYATRFDTAEILMAPTHARPYHSRPA